jgi:hypothetical protein
VTRALRGRGRRRWGPSVTSGTCRHGARRTRTGVAGLVPSRRRRPASRTAGRAGRVKPHGVRGLRRHERSARLPGGRRRPGRAGVSSIPEPEDPAGGLPCGVGLKGCEGRLGRRRSRGPEGPGGGRQLLGSRPRDSAPLQAIGLREGAGAESQPPGRDASGDAGKWSQAWEGGLSGMAGRALPGR